MNNDDKGPVYLFLGLALTVGLCSITYMVLNHIEITCAIKAGLVQELKSEEGVVKVIWVKGKQND